MAHMSPEVYLVWTILMTALGSFLVYHLWSFDRFKCLKWNQGPYAGAFKRIMTYSYMLTIPFIATYALGFTIIKYNYGFTVIPKVGVVPTPHQLWNDAAQDAIFPLNFSLSVGWGLEMVTHLEELCFWLFLVNAGSTQQDWFRSLYFKVWAIGSGIALLALPLITILTRGNLDKGEAYTFLAGGLGSLSLTIWFLPILWTFPSFIANLKMNDVENVTLVRLTKYHELNCIRVVFRFLFTVPVVILGIDGVRPHQHINDKLFPTDLLAILAGVGVVVSSAITLVIFFPRSYEGEMTQREQQRARRRQRAQHYLSRWTRSDTPSDGHAHTQSDDSRSYISITQQSKTDLDHFDPPHNPSLSVSFGVAGYGNGNSNSNDGHGKELPAYELVMAPPSHGRLGRGFEGNAAFTPLHKKAFLEEGMGYTGGGSFSLKPNRRTDYGDVELGAVLSDQEVELARARSKRDRSRGVSSLVHHWRSPIDIGRPVVVSRWQRQA